MRKILLVLLASLAAALLLALPARAQATLLPPKGLWVAATGPTSVTWAWDPVDGATGYRIAMSTSAAMSHPRIRTVTGRVVGFGNLDPGTYYYARVRALTGSTMSDPSNLAYAKAGAVAKPFAAAEQGRDFVDVRWVPYSGADKYQVQCSTTPTFKYNVDSMLVSGRTATFGVERDSYGYFRVRAIRVTSTGIKAASQWSPMAKAYVPYHPV